MKEQNIKLGDEVKCIVTGFKGIAVARCEWLFGCARITIQPYVDKDGKLQDMQTFDEPSLKITKYGKVKPSSNHTGGSQDDRQSTSKAHAPR
jgi:hypothetical protein